MKFLGKKFSTRNMKRTHVLNNKPTEMQPSVITFSLLLNYYFSTKLESLYYIKSCLVSKHKHNISQLSIKLTITQFISASFSLQCGNVKYTKSKKYPSYFTYIVGHHFCYQVQYANQTEFMTSLNQSFWGGLNKR